MIENDSASVVWYHGPKNRPWSSKGAHILEHRYFFPKSREQNGPVKKTRTSLRICFGMTKRMQAVLTTKKVLVQNRSVSTVRFMVLGSVAFFSGVETVAHISGGLFGTIDKSQTLVG